MFDAIETTDWAAIPGFAKFYEPANVAPALRRVVDAVSAAQAANAAAGLFGGGLVHDHSAGVHPAAVIAAPILLDIAENAARPEVVRPIALALLDNAMRSHPYAGYTNLATPDGPDGPDIPLCCAVARIVRARAALLRSFGRSGTELLREADRHWHLTIAEVSAGVEPDSALVIGRLEGIPEPSPTPCDLRHPGNSALRLTATAELAWPVDEATTSEACIILRGISPDRLLPGSALCSPCSDRVH